MSGDLAGVASRLELTPAGLVRNIAADPQKAAANLARSQLTAGSPPQIDLRTKITPEEALREAMFDSDGHKLAELLTGNKSESNSEVWREAANKPLPYKYLHKVFGIRWSEYWARRFLLVLIRLAIRCTRIR
jgi:hypothetical protein